MLSDRVQQSKECMTILKLSLKETVARSTPISIPILTSKLNQSYFIDSMDHVLYGTVFRTFTMYTVHHMSN